MKNATTIWSALLVLTLTSTLAAQLTQTLPAGFDTLDASSSTAYPQNSTTDHIWQWHYDSSQFAATGPIIITEVAIRASTPTETVGAFNFSNFTVTLIEASTDYQVVNHNPVFAANVLTSAQVRSGPWTGGPVVPPAGATAAPWIPMGLTGSFIYDPTLGNDFIVQIEKCGTVATWAASLDGPTGSAGAVGGNRYGDINTCTATSSTFNNNEFVPVVQITYTPVPQLADDLKMDAILAPASTSFVCQPLASNEPITVRVKNLGMNVINPGTVIPMVLVVDGGSSIIEFYSPANALAFNQTDTFTFSATANLSSGGTHSITVTSLYGADLNPANDTLVKTVESSTPGIVAAFPWTESFDAYGAVNGSTAPPPEWTNDANDAGGTAANGDWIFSNAPTPNVNTGPAADHTTGTAGAGFFAYVNDAGSFSGVSLTSPCLDLSSTTFPTLTFWLHSDLAPGAAAGNSFSIDVLTNPSGAATLDVFGPQAPLNAGWTFHIVDLGPWVGQTIRLRFRASSNVGASTNDIAIDDVGVFDALPGPGQAPQPGLAVFELNGALDTNGLPVSFGINGPYRSSVSAGAPLAFEFSGAANQAIVLLAGPTNPALALFPPVGQLDIGSSINMVSGLPQGLVLVGDGTQADFINALFRTQATGHQSLVFPMPALPIGYVTTFQALMFTGGPTVIAASNAIELFAL